MEILDSRGRPTLEVCCELEGGARAWAQVPSGASTGAAEARELRDGDPTRHAGLGCRQAVRSVKEELARSLAGCDLASQAELDEALRAQDGTPDLSRLGANAILGVSLAFARAEAQRRCVPLYRHFAGMVGESGGRLPRPTINLFSGGKHAGGQVAIQDVLVLPVSAATFDEALEDACAVFRAAARGTGARYGSRALVADEGGLAPPFPSVEAMLDDAVRAIEEAGLRPGEDVALAVDVASSHFHEAGRYRMDGIELDAQGMIDRLEGWVDRFPIRSVEDGLAEDAWEAWPELRRRLAGRALVLGDDLLCTNPDRIRRARTAGAADALLLKVNQIGTLTGAAEANRLAREAGWHVTVSARSGETEDHWLADLAVGWRGDHIKIGSITRSERLAKYNRLLAIEAESGWPLAEGPGTSG